MTLSGYQTYLVSPFETASNFTAIVTGSNATVGTAATKLNYPSGTYDLAVNYYDLIGGRSHWTIYVNDREVGAWVGNHEDILGHAPSTHLGGHSASRITFKGVKIQKGDELKIVGAPDGIEPAPLDYILVLPPGIVD
jgi:alpha-glucuronidase